MLPEIPIPALPFVGAYGIKVRSLASLEQILTRSGASTRRRQRDLVAVFPEELGRGAWLFVGELLTLAMPGPQHRVQ